MPDLTGIDVGRYHVVERLGQGGMAEVYKAFDTRLQREVALKVIRKDMIAQAFHDTMMKRFEREALALARLSHPNIVKVFDFGEYDEAPYLVMEYLTGGTLSLKTAGKPLSWREASRLLAPVASALDYAHAEGILHRDVKPANILLTRQGQPMLSDFGIAKILDMEGNTQLTGTSMGIGTPEYMAPEQWGGKPVAQTDIYALGVVFFELITGKRPYTADTPFAVMRKQLTDPLPRPSQCVADLPDLVEQVLFKALARDPQDRYHSMADFATMLDKMAMGQVESAHPQEPGDTFSDQTRKVSLVERQLPPLVETHPQVVATQVDNAPIPAIGQPSAVTQVDSTPIPAARQPSAVTQVNSTPIPRIPAYEALPVKKPGNKGNLVIVFGVAVGSLLILAVLAGLGFLAWNSWLSPEAQFRNALNTRADLIQAPSPGPTAVGQVNLSPSLAPTSRSNVARMVNKDGMGQFWVGSSYFIMGSTENNDEQPIHKVSLEGFWIDETEVTNGMYASCVAAGACKAAVSRASHTRHEYYGSSDFKDYPVVYVDWDMANTYCQYMGKRLPTEAEWEKAARGPNQLDYPWGNEKPTCRLANFMSCAGDTTQAGGHLDGASPYGALDMGGNVWEWVADWYGAAYYINSVLENPLGPASGQEHVARGGSFMNTNQDIRTAKRYKGESLDYDILGFRCAQSP
jgi:serine/threonine protein kinase